MYYNNIEDRDFEKNLAVGDMFHGTNDIRHANGYIVLLAVRAGVAQCFSLERKVFFLTAISQLKNFYQKVA